MICHSVNDRIKKIKRLREKSGIVNRLPAGTKSKVESRILNKLNSTKKILKIIIPLQTPHEFSDRKNNYRYRKWTSHPGAGLYSGVYEKSAGSGWDKVIIQRWIQVESYATIHASGRCAMYYFDSTHKLYKAPRGWIFDNDCNGLKIVNKSRRNIEYHLHNRDFSDLKNACRLAHELSKKRLEKERESKREEKEFFKWMRNHRTIVTLTDSLACGNCFAGTMNFIQRFKLKTCVSSEKLESIALKASDSLKRRIKLVIHEAYLREKRYFHAGADLFYPSN